LPIGVLAGFLQDLVFGLSSHDVLTTTGRIDLGTLE